MEKVVQIKLFSIFKVVYQLRTLVCCGVVFAGQLGEKALDQRFYKPCSRKKRCLSQSGAEEASNMDSETWSETYDTDNREFYEESGKASMVEDDNSNFDQIDTDFDSESFSTCD